MSVNRKTIPLFKVYMSEDVDRPLLETIHSGWIGEGPKVEEFENILKKYFGNPYIATVNNGTSALHLAYHMSLYPDEPKTSHVDTDAEIISTAITCTATNTPIINNGARIVWADVDPLTGNVDPRDIENKITKNTRAIAMVHWGGNPCLIDEINEIAHRHSIKTVEDNAHGIAMKYKGKPCGNSSDYTCISLQAIKSVTSVDGGILMMKDKVSYDRAMLLRWYGIDRTRHEGVDLRCEIDVSEAGYKFHMNDICTLIGNANFRHIDEIVKINRSNAAFYNETFADCDKITLTPENPDGEASYWLYTFHVDNRDVIMRKLNEAGIMASKVHARNDTHSMFREYKAELPNVEIFNQRHLCIPVGWWVNEEDREYIAETVLKIVKENS